MNNPFRAIVQEKYEIPILLGMSSGGKKYSCALEIGCGNGNGARLIKKYFDPDRIVAIDLDRKMIGFAQANNRDPSIEFMEMDAANLVFPDNSFDVVIDFGIIHHIPDWHACIRELKRVLKNNGRLILEELSTESFSGFPGNLWKKILAHPYDQMFSAAQFEKYLNAVGFVILEKKYFNPLGLLKHIALGARIDKETNAQLFGYHKCLNKLI